MAHTEFTRPVSRLAVIAPHDAQLDELLQPYDGRAWTLIEPDGQVDPEELVERAKTVIDTGAPVRRS